MNSQGGTLISQHQLDVLVLALLGGLAVVCVLVVAASLLGQWLAASRRASTRPVVRGGRR